MTDKYFLRKFFFEILYRNLNVYIMFLIVVAFIFKNCTVLYVIANILNDFVYTNSLLYKRKKLVLFYFLPPLSQLSSFC